MLIWRGSGAGDAARAVSPGQRFMVQRSEHASGHCIAVFGCFKTKDAAILRPATTT